MSAATPARLGMQPLARFVSFALASVDPVEVLTGPIPATKKVLAKAGRTIDDIDAFEINEAFAAVLGAWAAELQSRQRAGESERRCDCDGPSARCLGRPPHDHLVHHLRNSNRRYGLQSMCEGGGMANATIIERL